MRLYQTLIQTSARSIILWHLISLGTVGVGGVLATHFAAHLNIVILLSLISGLALIITCRIIQILVRLLKWERQLTQLAVEIAGSQDSDLSLPAWQNSISINPFDLKMSSGGQLADRGWNLLVEAGRRWESLAELEQTIAKNLTSDRRQSGLPLLDFLSDGVVTISENGLITYANTAFVAMCEKENLEEVLGHSLIEAFDLDEATRQKFVAPSREVESRVEWKTSQGTRTLVGIRRVGRKSDNESIAWVWTFRDVTQQRLAEAMRDQFLSHATHEFRTPLANIRAYAESLDMAEDLDTESQKKFFNVIQSESVRLSQLVDDLLDISRMQAGALTMDSHETDLERLIEEVAAKVQGEMQQKMIEFRCEFPPKVPKVTLDKAKLTAALVNLLGNAAKYTPEKGRVTFRVEAQSQKIKFIVSDSGIGIAPEELPRVFDRFFRSSDDRVRDITGSGLGLALSQEIARLHGGEITVSSVLDQGSSFCLDIPLEAVLV